MARRALTICSRVSGAVPSNSVVSAEMRSAARTSPCASDSSPTNSVTRRSVTVSAGPRRIDLRFALLWQASEVIALNSAIDPVDRRESRRPDLNPVFENIRPEGLELLDRILVVDRLNTVRDLDSHITSDCEDFRLSGNLLRCGDDFDLFRGLVESFGRTARADAVVPKYTTKDVLPCNAFREILWSTVHHRRETDEEKRYNARTSQAHNDTVRGRHCSGARPGSYPRSKCRLIRLRIPLRAEWELRRSGGRSPDSHLVFLRGRRACHLSWRRGVCRPIRQRKRAGLPVDVDNGIQCNEWHDLVDNSYRLGKPELGVP